MKFKKTIVALLFAGLVGSQALAMHGEPDAKRPRVESLDDKISIESVSEPNATMDTAELCVNDYIDDNVLMQIFEFVSGGSEVAAGIEGGLVSLKNLSATIMPTCKRWRMLSLRLFKSKIENILGFSPLRGDKLFTGDLACIYGQAKGLRACAVKKVLDLSGYGSNELFKHLLDLIIDWIHGYAVREIGWISYWVDTKEMFSRGLDEASLLRIEGFVNSLLSFQDDEIFTKTRLIGAEEMTRFFIAYKILEMVRSVVPEMSEKIPNFCQSQHSHMKLFYDKMYERVKELTNGFRDDTDGIEPDCVDISFFYLLKQLIEDPIAMISFKELDGMSWLHHAVQDDDDCAVQMFIVAGADVNSQTKSGLTPLHLAVSSFYGDENILKILIYCKADPNIYLYLGSIPGASATCVSPLGLAVFTGNVRARNLLTISNRIL